jgi:hypothetical protein
MNNLRKKLGNRLDEDQLKKLADKFVTYFSGTFQCNVGHQVILLFQNRLIISATRSSSRLYEEANHD